MKKDLFRKTSLEAASSPEDLDRLMQITRPRSWIALSALALLLVSASAWAIGGEIPEKVRGDGILVRAGGIFEVVTTGSGRMMDVAVAVGDTVRQGQVIGRISQPELVEEVEAARSELQNQRTLYDEIRSMTERVNPLQEALVTQLKRTLEESIASGEAELGWLHERVRAQERLVEQGLMVRRTVLETRQQYDAAQRELSANRSQIQQLEVQELDRKSRKQEELLASKARITEAELSLSRLESDLSRASEVVSSYGGRVLEIMTEPGHVVDRGEPILRLELIGPSVQSLTAIVYVPASEGKKLRPGMTIHVSPSTVRQEEHGLMLGRVTFVSDFPATFEGMSRILKNQQLATSLSGGDAPYEVHAELVPTSRTMSRYEWTSVDGPALTIESGTLCSAQITVRKRRPIAIVLPFVASS